MSRDVVTDANVFINLVRADLVALLAQVTDREFVIPDAVLEEITYPEQRTVIDDAIADGTLRLVRLEDPDGLADYAALRDRMGRGEATCLALAGLNAEWLLASDERRVFRRIAIARIGVERILTTPGIILHMIKGGVLGVEEADRAKAKLEAHRFKMAFESFRTLIDDDRNEH